MPFRYGLSGCRLVGAPSRRRTLPALLPEGDLRTTIAVVQLRPGQNLPPSQLRGRHRSTSHHERNWVAAKSSARLDPRSRPKRTKDFVLRLARKRVGCIPEVDRIVHVYLGSMGT